MIFRYRHQIADESRTVSLMTNGKLASKLQEP